MKKYIILIAAVALFLCPFSAFALNTPSQGSINTPALWVPNTASSTITPNPNTLKVPCANIVGGCAASSSQSLNTTSTPTFGGLTVNGNVTSTGLTISSTSPVTIPNLSGYFFFPTPAQLTAGATCGTTTAVTEVGNCFADILAAANASGTAVFVGPYVYPTSLWTNPINITTNQRFLTIECIPNVSSFNWGGNGTSTFWNYGNSGSASGYISHTAGAGSYGCSYFGPSANGTTTFAVIGGTFGAEGWLFMNNRVQGYGKFVQASDNTFNINIILNQVIDNGQAILFPSGLANAGEKWNVTHNIFSDQDSLPTGIQRTSSSLEHYIDIQNVVGFNFCFNSLDDGGITNESAAQGTTVCDTYMENPGVAHNSAYPAYHYITNVASAQNSLMLSNVTVMQDATSTEVTSTANAFIANGGAMNINGFTAINNPNNNATTTKYLVIETASTASLQSQGVVNVSGTAFSYLDQNAPTSTAGMQLAYGAVGSTTAAFSVATGTITGTINYFTGMQSGKVTWVASNTGGTQDIITFARAFTVEPVCTMTSASGTNATAIIRSQRVTTTTLTFADSSAFATSSAFDFICVGNPN